MNTIKIYTMGFTKRSAENFFTTLTKNDVKRVIDIRLNNVSQLAGFTKKDDLCFFLEAICGIDYLHQTELAPTQEIMDDFKKHGGGGKVYEESILRLMSERKIETQFSRELLDGACLLCSEDTPEHCHRRLVAEYLQHKWGDVEIIHL